MFLGKLIYRSVNYFEEVSKPNTDHLKAEVDRMIEDLSETSQKYIELKNQLQELEQNNFFQMEGISSATRLNQELSAIVGELERVSSPHYRKILSKESLKNLEETKNRLKNIKNELVAIFTTEDKKTFIIERLNELRATAQEEFNAYQAKNEEWKIKQHTALATIKKKTAADIHQEIHLKISKDTEKIEIKDYPAIENYLSTVYAFNSFIPGYYSSDEADEFNEAIDKLQQPKGISNIGNSCYMNSLLQALCANPAFYQMLNTPIEIPIYKEQTGATDEVNTTNTFNALDLELPKQKNEGSKSQKTGTSTKGLVKNYPVEQYWAKRRDLTKAKNLQNALRFFILAHRSKNTKAIGIAAYGFRERLIEAGVITANQRFRQQDSDEFMTAVLEKLNYPLLDIVERKAYTDVEAGGYVREESSQLTSLKLTIKDPEGHMVSNTFQGLIDHHFSSTPQSDKLSLNDGPNMTHTWDETTRLKKIPESLNISLKRFVIVNPVNGLTAKIQGQITLPAGNIVDLRDAFTEGVVPDGESTKYQIVSVIQHMGGTSGGHYTANIYKNGQWYHCDDSDVGPTAGNVGRDGYVFVLKRL